MAIVWADVTNVAPGLTTAVISVGMQTAILDRVNNHEVDDAAWGEYADIGRAYLAAHLASIRNNTGMITSETLGPMSRSYANLSQLNSYLALSVFGVEYLRLLRLAVGPAAFVV